MQSEKFIERKLKEAVEENGGMCIKFLPYLLNGLPDRICLFKGGVVKFVEVKGEKQKPRKLQLLMHEKLKRLGFDVRIIDDVSQISDFIDETRTVT